MVTTATSLHVLSAVVGVGSQLPVDIEKAYRKLGYARPKKAPEPRNPSMLSCNIIA